PLPASSVCVLSLLPLRFPLLPYTALFRSRGPAKTRRRRGRRVPGRGLPSRPAPTRRAHGRLDRSGHVGHRRPCARRVGAGRDGRSEEHTSELQSHLNLVCRLLLEKKKKTT